ncbi:MAG: M56 family metallopeptidase [Planctomycetaceae bacterium]|nr:M56 family metallopeptidase [Planctomycetaceae bacterium]
MLPFFDLLKTCFFVTLQHSLTGIALIAFLLVVTHFAKNVSKPRLLFCIWLLVPVQLLWFFSTPSVLSVFNYLPRIDWHPPATIRDVSENISINTQQSAVSVPQKTMLDQEGFESFEAIPLFESQSDTITPPATASAVQSDVQSPVPISHVGPGGVIAVVWGMGVLMFYAVCFVQVLRVRRLIRNGNVVTDQKTLQIFEECKAVMRVKSWVMLVESSRINGPFLTGIVRPVIVLPDWDVQIWNPDELRHLFYHELAHLKRSDLIVGWLMTLLLGLHWFNPFVWLAVRTMGRLREEACDGRVLQHLEAEQQLDYGNTLLNISKKLIEKPLIPGMVGILETKSFLKRRIEMITHPPVGKKSRSILILCGCILVAWALVTEAKPQNTQPETTKSATENEWEKYWMIDKPSHLRESQPQNTDEKKVTSASDKKEEAVDPKRVPKIVNIFPKNKAKNVDPNITQVYVTFDIPMTEGMAWAQRSDRTAIDSEEGQRAFWTADKRTCVLPVKLTPEKTYEVLMNFKPFLGFYSEGGVPAKELFYTFATGRGPISQNARDKYAEKNLTPKSNSPAKETMDSAKKSDEKFADADLEAKARKAIQLMAKRGKCWLFAPDMDVKSWSYHFKATGGVLTIYEAKGGGDDPKTIEHDITLNRQGIMPWEEIRGITYLSCLQTLAMLIDDGELVRFKSVEFDDREVKLHFILTDGKLTCHCGNGIRGQWFGYFSASATEGKLTLDRKTMMPKLLVLSEKLGERFGNYVPVGDGMFAPKRVQVKNGEMLFDMQFNVYNPGLWLLDKSTLIATQGDKKFETRAENSNVKVNGEPAIVSETKPVP